MDALRKNIAVRGRDTAAYRACPTRSFAPVALAKV